MFNMNLTKRSSLMLLAGALVVSMLNTSCERSHEGGPAHCTEPSEKEKEAIMNMVATMPAIKFSQDGKDYVITHDKDGWNFAAAAETSTSWDVSGSVQYVGTDGGGKGMFVVGGSANTGGTVVAGSTALTIDASFCFSAEDDSEGFNPIGVDGASGTAAVIGIDGDFQALANASQSGEEIENIDDYFFGFAYYFVFADDIQNGSYKVIDFQDYDDQSDNEDKSLSFVVDIKNGKMYVSKDGNVTINGGNMSFNGNYYGFDFDWEEQDTEEEPKVSTESGYGQMGCD